MKTPPVIQESRPSGNYVALGQISLLLLLAASSAQSLAASPTLAKAAAQKTASSNVACTTLPNFYWEIGDSKGLLASGTRGLVPPKADAQMAIYSAGKWVYAAYIYEKAKTTRPNGLPTLADIRSLNMTAGYIDKGQCLLQDTVGTCQASIAKLDPAAVSKFSYGPGHFQRQASLDFKLSTQNKALLASEMVKGLGGGFAFDYAQPQLAGGARSSAKDYAIFLRKILSGTLMRGVLGTNKVCTYTGLTDLNTGRKNCPTSLYSPASDALAGIVEAWSYSMGHWVEDDPVNGDGAFSSPGAGGFYPWIDSSKSYYGILARLEVTPAASANSVKCGRLIRKAWLTGIAQ